MAERSTDVDDEGRPTELVRRAIQVKIDVVVADLKETAGFDGGSGHPGREALNYGHTLAHAIERAEDYRIRHGEAVAIGCCFIAEVARRTGGLDDDIVDRHASVFGAVGLPTTYDGASFDEAADEMVGALREYADDWAQRLRLAPNHAANWALVQLVGLSDDDELRGWITGE